LEVKRMNKFDYNIKADILPTGGKPGDKLTVTAQISDVVGEIGGVYVSVSQHGLCNRLSKKDECTYSMDYVIPWIAPSGTYKVSLYAVDKNYKRGPSVTIDYEIS
jgi:hypothetical protein